MRIRLNVGGSDSKNRPRGIVGKGCTSIFFAIFALFGVFFIATMGIALYETATTYTWTKSKCEILESAARETDDEDKPFRFEVRYAYEFRGKPHVSDVYEDGYEGSDDYSETRRLAEKYKPGSKAVCYVNPSDPSKAILERKGLWFGFFIFLPLIFVAVGVGGIYATWRRKKKRPDGSPAPEPISAKARGKKSNAWVGASVCGVFFVAGIVAFYFMFLRPVLRIQEAKSWVETPCMIEKAWVKSHESDDSTTYSVEVLYRYEFGGRTRKSSRYSFGTGSSSGYESKKAVVNELLRNPNRVCYVNPGDPAEAVLERGLVAEIWFGLFTLIFIVIGSVGLFFCVRQIRKKKAETISAAAEPYRPSFTEPVERPISTGPVTLTSKASPVTKLVGVTLFALFWNGVVSIFVYQLIQAWSRGRPDWFHTLFLIPFVLVGLGLIGGIFYCVLALFNPRPKLTLGSVAVPLGGGADLKWEMSGDARRIGKFEIVLEGREEARYQRGTSTYTDKQVFATLPLFETDDPRDMIAGATTFSVPAGTMHSFEAANNKIIWALRVRGDIRRWPDIKEEFPFTVLPLPIETENR